METTSKFGTGAVRSKDAEATRYDLISPIALAAVAETYAEGAAKYSDFNWEKGMPIHDLLNHGIRHIYLYLSGDRSEPHLAHAAWNLMASIHSEKCWPHLNVGTLRGPGCTPPSGGDWTERLHVESTEPGSTVFLDGEPFGTLPAESASSKFPPFGEWEINGVRVDSMGGDGASEPGYRPLGKPLEVPIQALGVTVATLQAQPFVRLSAGDIAIGIATPPSEPTAVTPAPVAPTTQPSGPPVPPVATATGTPDKSSVVLYLSGPMAGLPDYNFPAFDEAAASLRALGWRVVSPADFGAKPGVPWETHLQRDLFILGHCDWLVQLPGWEQSDGARLEHHCAERFSKKIVSLAEVFTIG